MFLTSNYSYMNFAFPRKRLEWILNLLMMEMGIWQDICRLAFFDNFEFLWYYDIRHERDQLQCVAVQQFSSLLNSILLRITKSHVPMNLWTTAEITHLVSTAMKEESYFHAILQEQVHVVVLFSCSVAIRKGMSNNVKVYFRVLLVLLPSVLLLLVSVLRFLPLLLLFESKNGLSWG